MADLPVASSVFSTMNRRLTRDKQHGRFRVYGAESSISNIYIKMKRLRGKAFRCLPSSSSRFKLITHAPSVSDLASRKVYVICEFRYLSFRSLDNYYSANLL